MVTQSLPMKTVELTVAETYALRAILDERKAQLVRNLNDVQGKSEKAERVRSYLISQLACTINVLAKL